MEVLCKSYEISCGFFGVLQLLKFDDQNVVELLEILPQVINSHLLFQLELQSFMFSFQKLNLGNKLLFNRINNRPQITGINICSLNTAIAPFTMMLKIRFKHGHLLIRLSDFVQIQSLILVNYSLNLSEVIWQNCQFILETHNRVHSIFQLFFRLSKCLFLGVEAFFCCILELLKFDLHEPQSFFEGCSRKHLLLHFPQPIIQIFNLSLIH